MKHIRLFESFDDNPIFKVNEKPLFNDHIGSIWSIDWRKKTQYNLYDPLSYRPDFYVHNLPEFDDHGSIDLFAIGLKQQIRDYLNSDNTSLCWFCPTDFGKNKEFDFSKNVVDEKSFVIIRDKGVLKIFEDYIFKDEHYKETIKRLLRRYIGFEELENIGSWHINAKYYNVSGIKILSFAFTHTEKEEYFFMEKNKVSKLVSLTDTFQYYTFSSGKDDPNGQFFRFGEECIYLYQIGDVTLDLQDIGIKLEDALMDSYDSFICRFKPNSVIEVDEGVISDLKSTIRRVEIEFKVKLSEIDIYRKNTLNQKHEIGHFSSFDDFYKTFNNYLLNGTPYEFKSNFIIDLKFKK